ncbi:hypothetical protein KKE14_01550 [Patescibacteria group bacterium]|nr:hypothetical protein [Patescibacteria group bacterium]
MSSLNKKWAFFLALMVILPILGGCTGGSPTTPVNFVVRLDPSWGVTVYPEVWGDIDVPLSAMAVDNAGNVLASDPSDFTWYGSAQVNIDGEFHFREGMNYGLYECWVEHNGVTSNTVQINVVHGAPPTP